MIQYKPQRSQCIAHTYQPSKGITTLTTYQGPGIVDVLRLRHLAWAVELSVCQQTWATTPTQAPSYTE